MESLRARNPVASAAAPRGARQKVLAQGEDSRSAGRRRVVVAVDVTVAVAVAGDYGRSERGNASAVDGQQSRDVGAPSDLLAVVRSRDRSLRNDMHRV